MDYRPLLAALVLSALPALSVRAQETPDTTSAARYVSLAVGNVWEYVSHYDGADHPERRTVAADTLIGGVRYVRYDVQALAAGGAPQGAPTRSYLRFDAPSTEVRAWEGAAPPPLDLIPGCALGAPFGSQRSCVLPSGLTCETGYGGGYGQPVTIGDDVVMTSVKTLGTGNCELNSTFAAGVGFVSFVTLGGTTRLQFARVGGVEYGQALTADVEGAPGTSVVSVRVAPNPAPGGAVVTLRRATAGPAHVGVYDAQGRQVALLYSGPLAAGAQAFPLRTAGLPAGTYVVRVSGEGAAAVSFTVAR